MGEKGEGAPKPKYVWKNVFTGKNPDTGKSYFERQRVRVEDPSQPPEVPADPDLLTKEQIDKALAEKMAKAWDANTDENGRGPIGGAQD